MSEGERPPHAVLLRSPEKFAPAPVAAVLAKMKKQPALDFVGPVKAHWGVIAESLPAAEADALAARLNEAGLAALAAPTTLLETPPAPVMVTKAELSGDGFDVVSGRANAAPERQSWSHLAVICAGGVEVKESKTITEKAEMDIKEKAVRLGLTMATGIPMMGGKKEVTRVVETKDRALTLDLLFLNPARRLRIEARAFDYSMLGPKMAHAAEVNFGILVGEIASRAPSALRGKGTRGFVNKTGDWRYDSLADLDREERWLLTLSALKAAL